MNRGLNDESAEIVKRFYTALYACIKVKKLRGKKTFTDRYNIDRPNFCKQEQDHTKQIFQVSWIKNLVEDYGVSCEFLLLGKGRVFVSEVDNRVLEYVNKYEEKPKRQVSVFNRPFGQRV